MISTNSEWSFTQQKKHHHWGGHGGHPGRGIPPRWLRGGRSRASTKTWIVRRRSAKIRRTKRPVITSPGTGQPGLGMGGAGDGLEGDFWDGYLHEISVFSQFPIVHPNNLGMNHGRILRFIGNEAQNGHTQ